MSFGRAFITCTALVIVISAGFFVFQRAGAGSAPSVSFYEPVFEEMAEEIPSIHPRLAGLEDWVRPEGPLRVALQVGHWKAGEAPEEQKGLRNNTGASGGGKAEWEVNLAIAEEAKLILEARGITTEIIPTTIPPNYWADAFIAIHADGNRDDSISGYKIASPRRDYSGKAQVFEQLLYEAYGTATGLSRDANITRNMRGYYAFNWRRYDHSLHPKTPAVILETGFLTSPSDRRVIVNAPEKSAAGIANAVVKFLEHANDTNGR